MRLKPEKIEDLAQKVVQELKKHDDVAFRSDEDVVFHEIKDVIQKDLQREEDLEEEVREILQQHMKRIYRDDISFSDLVRKAKKQMARKRGLVL
jgi:hypothetical protein